MCLDQAVAIPWLSTSLLLVLWKFQRKHRGQCRKNKSSTIRNTDVEKLSWHIVLAPMPRSSAGGWIWGIVQTNTWENCTNAKIWANHYWVKENNKNYRGMTFLGVYQASCGRILLKIGGNQAGAFPDPPIQPRNLDFSRKTLYLQPSIL